MADQHLYALLPPLRVVRRVLGQRHYAGGRLATGAVIAPTTAATGQHYLGDSLRLPCRKLRHLLGQQVPGQLGKTESGAGMLQSRQVLRPPDHPPVQHLHGGEMAVSVCQSTIRCG
ncbi:hypothetical protein D3C78_1395330 [compost metagenome]